MTHVSRIQVISSHFLAAPHSALSRPRSEIKAVIRDVIHTEMAKGRVSGPAALLCGADNWEDFLRIVAVAILH